MYKISVSKELFDNILLKKTLLLSKENSKYWKKELLSPSIINNKIDYTIKQFDRLTITNGLGEDKPQLVIECQKVDYSISKDSFEFYLGKILEQKNTTLKEDYKDNLIEQLLKEKQVLEDRLSRDSLTQLYNRKKMQDDLSEFSKHKNSFMLTTIFIDIDRFKEINDNFSYDAGNKILMYLANKLQKYAKALNGETYRFSGGEFVILCFITKDKLIAKLNELKEDIKSEKIQYDLKDISITLSIGVSFFSDSKSVNEMIIKANEYVHKAKNNGRDRIEIA